MDLTLGILNGFPNRFVWDIKRSAWKPLVS